MGTMARRWVAAKVGVCEICAALDGKLIAMDESYDIPGMELFEGMHQTPPAHPRCRCAVEYVEVKPETTGSESPKNTIDNGGGNGIIRENSGKEKPITPEQIVKELEKAPIGQEIIEYLENNNVAIRLNYERQWHFDRGYQAGNEIQIFMSNQPSVRVAAQTVIHEVTHAKYDIGDCQWAEAVCMAQEKSF